MKIGLVLLLAMLVAVSGCIGQTGQSNQPGQDNGTAATQPVQGNGPAAHPDVTQPSQQAQVPQDYLDQAIEELNQTVDIPAPVKEFNVTARQWAFDPATIEVSAGDRVILHVTSVDVAHGFWLPEFNINEQLDPGKTITADFIADKPGTYPFICSVFCGQGHTDMKGQLVVK